MARTFEDYLSQRWEDKRTPTPEYAQILMEQYEFRHSYRVEHLHHSWHKYRNLHNKIDVNVAVFVQWRGEGVLTNRNKHFANEVCCESDVESVRLRLERDAFKKAFRHFPRIRKALWRLYQHDRKWAQRQADIYNEPKMEYLNYCEFLT